ncbi:MAG TPA: TPM domain-containing protein [Pyrinomonadaceae bacterium]
MIPLKRLTISVLLVASFLGAITSCKRISNINRADPSPVPATGSAAPAPCSVPFNGDFVNDTAGVLNDDSRNKLEQKLDLLKTVGKIDFAVVTVKTTGEQAIAEHSLALARCWSIGNQNPDGSGMLMLLAVDDRKWHMQISRSMEKVLSNEEIQDAGSQMTPLLRDRNYPVGIDKFVDATINTIAARRKFSMPTTEQ